MRKFRYDVLIGFTALMIAACATVPTSDIKVETETAPGADLTSYKTYAWLAAAKIVNDPAGHWEPPQFDADAEIKWLIDREMRARGINEVSSFPDMFVAFVAGIDMAQLELKEDPKTKIEVLKNAPKGALAVLFIDGATGDPVWAGAAVGDVKGDRPAEEMKARLDYAVKQMFRKLPSRKSN
jgi:hypothetical protein